MSRDDSERDMWAKQRAEEIRELNEDVESRWGPRIDGGECQRCHRETQMLLHTPEELKGMEPDRMCKQCRDHMMKQYECPKCGFYNFPKKWTVCLICRDRGKKDDDV